MVVPRCDLCGKPAEYDAKTVWGPWANVCRDCFNLRCNKQPGYYTKLQFEPKFSEYGGSYYGQS